MAEDVIVTTSKGVKLKLSKPPIFAVQEVERLHGLLKPKPPTIYLEDRDRYEPNESDPLYKAALDDWNASAFIRQFDSLASTGVKVLEVPAGIYPVESPEWAEPLMAVGIEIAEKGTTRFLQWLRYYAASDMSDFSVLLGRLMVLVGTTEEAVTEAVDAFRSSIKRPTDTDVAPEGSANGNRTDSSDGGSSPVVRGVVGDGSTPLQPTGVG